MQIGEASSCVIMEQGPGLGAGKNKFLFSGGYLFNDDSSLTSAGTDGELVKSVVSQTIAKARIEPGESSPSKHMVPAQETMTFPRGAGFLKCLKINCRR